MIVIMIGTTFLFCDMGCPFWSYGHPCRVTARHQFYFYLIFLQYEYENEISMNMKFHSFHQGSKIFCCTAFTATQH